MQDPRFIFGIPLRAKASSQDWEAVTRLLKGTLASVLGQTVGNFQVVLACHDVPDGLPKDDRILVLQSGQAVPANYSEQMADKSYKRRMIASYARVYPDCYIMFLDADDLVERRVVEVVSNTLPDWGYIIDNGFEYNCEADIITFTPRFDKFCGSCAILKFRQDDLPKSADDSKKYLFDSFKSHATWNETARELRRPLQRFPFAASLYVTHHGDNHSLLSGRVGLKRRVLRFFTPRQNLDERMRKAFNIPASDWP